MADCDVVLELFAVAGGRGVFSGDIRRAGVSGNPSERIRELKKRGFTFRDERERYPSGKGWGKRWWITARPGSLSCPGVSHSSIGREPAPTDSQPTAPTMPGETIWSGQAISSEQMVNDLDAARDRLTHYDGCLFDPDVYEAAA